VPHDEDLTEAAEAGISAAPPAGARLGAWGMLAVTEACVAVAGWALVACGLPWQLLLTSYAVTNGWMAATFAPFGALVALRRPRLAVGWLFCGFALCYGLSAACISLAMWQATAGGPNHWSSTLGWLGVFIWTPAVAVFFPLIVLLFPDGHLPGRRWRWLAGLALANGVVWLLGGAFDPDAVSGMPFVTYRTVVLSGAWGRLAHTADYVGNILVESVALACLAVLMWRWQRSTGSQRAQLSWLAVGATIAVGLFAPTAVGVSTVWSTALLVGVPVLPAAAAVAVLRHRLLGIDVVINRTLVYVGLSAILLACFLAVVELASVIVGHDAGLGGSLAGAAVVAVAFSPVRQFLQRRVDTLIFGYRRDPSQALSQVTAQLLSDTDDEVEASLRAVSNSLRLPGLALVSGGRRIGPPVSGNGTETVIPLRYRSEAVGQLMVKPRRGQAALDASDLAALELVAAPIAAAVYALRLTEQLQRAQEEERRRLHRDLHDGLGPVLTAIALRADAAGNVSRTDQAKAHTLISEVADQARQAIDEVRRISHDLRPRGLERLGLLDALAREAGRFGSRLNGGALVVTTEFPETVPPLSAEVEDGAFQIAAEALTNIARHSDATAAVLRVCADRSLRIEILDNGAPDSGGWTEGFGITSMRDRAAGVGGTLKAGPTPAGGRVCAELPLCPTIQGASS
jgi:signal transduction histidine kinase